MNVMFTQEERKEFFSFLAEVKGNSAPYIRMRVMEFVHAMGVLRNTEKNFIIEFSKWLEMKFCKNNNHPDDEDWRALEESIFNVLK